jgi:hypothetical protein
MRQIKHGIKEGEIIFMSYVDDNDKIISGYFVLIKFSESIIQVRSNQNIIGIPTSRVIKLKQKIDADPVNSINERRRE